MADLKKVCVKWVDANEMHGWRCDEDVRMDGLPIVETLGFLFSQDDEYIKIVGSVSCYGGNLGSLTIPTGCILSIKELRVR